MFSRSRACFGRNPADRFLVGNFGFASAPDGEHAVCGASPYSKHHAPICQNRYPSPSLWPGPFGVRPLLLWAPGCKDSAGAIRQPAAEHRKSRRFHFSVPAFSLDSARITNLAGGRAECVFPNSSSVLRSWPRLRVACRRTASGRLQALRRARLSQVRPTTTSLLAQLSAVPPVPCATTRASATDHLNPAACGRGTVSTDHRGPAPRWSFRLCDRGQPGAV